MKLPAFEDLSKEQDRIYNLDLDGNYLVSGPPGTGKSVMAIYRAQALTFDDREPTILMFSRVLQQYTKQAAAQVDVAGYVNTFNSWFWGFWRKHYRTSPPQLAGDEWAHDWMEIAQRFMSQPPPAADLADLLVDEGQDLSLGFYRIARFIAKNITVFADENQKLLDLNTTLLEIERAINAKEHLELRRNYRNTNEIAKVAAKYYCGAPTGIPEAPTRRGERPALRNFEQMNDFVEFVARYVRGRTNLTVGIACPTQALQKKLLNRLNSRNLPVPTQTYMWNSPEHKTLNFNGPSVTIVNYRSLKGLEFDTLFVPELQQVTSDPTSANTRMMFYVLMSRARDELHLSWSGDGEMPAIVGALDGLVERP